MEYFFFILDYINIKIENNYFESLIFFFLFLLIYNTFSLPGNGILMASTGFFFGILIGFIISIITIVLGSLLFFLFVSFFLKKIFPYTYAKYSNKINEYISNSSFEYLVIFRMIPGPPLMFQNLILSILKIDKIKFLMTSFLGLSPIAFLCVFIGSKLNNFYGLKTFNISEILSLEYLFFVIVILFFLFIRIIYRKTKK